MWITGEVNLPAEVVEAHAEGRLVFFVGAGASMDAPSSLPSFTDLARQLADAARVPFDEKVALDKFLGRMPKEFDTHAHAHRLIAREDSAFNATHSAIVGVAAATGPARIVTTNFDDHLESAAAAASVQVDDKWFSAALPLGDSFTGIVHLHGSVLRAPHELVLTDRDFGRAYLTDAWATRFLQRMFDSFTVLFVGYSHDDPIMRYLSLGLPSRTRRYVLTHLPDDDKWDHLGIVPIRYPAAGHDHGALVAALQAWDVRARMGLLEHRARMKEIVDAGPTLTPVDYDYLVARLRRADGAKEFVQAAAGLAWLQWAEDLPEFRELFSGTAESEPAATLGNWFSLTYIVEPALHGAALQTVQRLGQQFSTPLFRSAMWAAEQLYQKDAEAGRRWKTFLATSVHGQSAPAHMEALLPYAPGDHGEHLAVIRPALRPFLVLKKNWLRGDEDQTTPPNAESQWHTYSETLTSHLLRLINDTAPGQPSLRSLLEDSLTSAYDLIDGYHGTRPFDPLSSSRSAIEPHQQDESREPIDALIDALRAFGEKALPELPDLPEQWWSFGRRLFRRLALHLIDIDTARDADDKLQWVLDHELLYEIDVKHEAFRILATTAKEASPARLGVLLAKALAGPPYPEDTPDRDRHVAYGTYNLLVWLTRAAPCWSEAAVALTELQAANPTFAPREHPDLDVWMTVGVRGAKLPIEPEGLVQAADEDPAQALDNLLERDYPEHDFDEPTWGDALSVIRRVAETRPDIGQQLWELIDRRDDPAATAGDLRRAIIGGWERADLGLLAEAITGLVATDVVHPDSARTISQYLLAQIRKQIDSDESPTIAAMRQLARDLWREHRGTSIHHRESDPSFLALNSWPGELATYWTIEIDRRWRHNREDWTGLNELERDALLDLLTGPEPTSDATRPALASATFFLFAADAAFTQAHIFPLFREDQTATQAWEPFLHHPRYNDRMLSAGFLDCFVAEWARLESLRQPALQNQFFGVVASILSFAGTTAEDRQRLLDQSVLAASGSYAPSSASSVVRLLRGDHVNGPDVWDLWLRNHVTARLEGLPRIAQAEELARWADAIPYLGARIPDAVELLAGRGIGLGSQYRVPDFPAGVFESYGSELVNHLAERVRNSSPTGWAVQRNVQELVETVRGGVGRDLWQQLIDAATQRGFLPEAPD